MHCAQAETKQLTKDELARLRAEFDEIDLGMLWC
jgi:hypothetical protein